MGEIDPRELDLKDQIEALQAELSYYTNEKQDQLDEFESQLSQQFTEAEEKSLAEFQNNIENLQADLQLKTVVMA